MNDTQISLSAGVGAIVAVLLQGAKKLWGLSDEAAAGVAVLLNFVAYGVYQYLTTHSWAQAIVGALVALGSGHITYQAAIKPMVKKG